MLIRRVLVTSATLALLSAPAFAQGMLVVHDFPNTGSVNSNLKYVPLDQLLDLALDLKDLLPMLATDDAR